MKTRAKIEVKRPPNLMLNRNARIPDLTRGATLKYSQAKKAVEVECVAEWANPSDHSKGFIRLSLTEVVLRRSHHREISSGLEPCELHGCKFLSPVSDRARLHNFAELKQQARKFYNAAIQ